MKIQQKPFFIFIFSLVFFFVESGLSKLQAGWSSPPANLHFSPPTPTLNGDLSLSGNAIITWLDTPSNNFLTSTYILNAPTWTPPQTLTTALSVATVPAMAINASAYSVSSWVETGAQTLVFSNFVGSAWGLPELVATATAGHTFIANSMDVDPLGNVIILYVQDNGDTTNTLFAATHQASGWVSQALFTSAPNEAILIQTVLFDDNGNAIINWATNNSATTQAAIYASNYTKASASFAPFITIFSGPGAPSTFYTDVSATGYGIVSWVVNSTDLYASIFTPGSGWSAATLLTSMPNINDIAASINNSGNAEVINDENTNSEINVSSYINGTWSTEVIATAAAGTNVNAPFIVIDAFGNALATWAVNDTVTNTTIFDSSTRVGLQGSWSTPVIVPSLNPPAGVFKTALRLMISPSDEPVFVYAFIAVSGFSDLEVIVGINIFPVQPAAAFSGKVIKNRFATQTDIIHRLTWAPSPSPLVTSYNIYRNDVLIAQVSAQTFLYDDHNRHKKEVDTYMLRAVIGNTESSSFTITVP